MLLGIFALAASALAYSPASGLPASGPPSRSVPPPRAGAVVSSSAATTSTVVEVVVPRLESGGLGINVDQDNAIATNDGQPGLQVGDVITAVDGEPLDGRSAGSVLTPGASSYTFTILRDPATAAAALEGVVLKIASDTADGSPRVGIFSYDDCAEGWAAKVADLVSTLEEGMDDGALSAEDLRRQLLGFWKLVLVSEAEFATAGLAGYGSEAMCCTMAHFQCFTEPSASGLAPTAQVVEVVGNTGNGVASLAALKGDFAVTAGGAGAAAVVSEAYTRTEFAGSTIEGAPRQAQDVRTTFLGPRLRVNRLDDGSVRLYRRMDADVAQNEIGKLLAARVPRDDGAGDDPRFDDMPIWMRRQFDNDRPDYRAPMPDSDAPM